MYSFNLKRQNLRNNNLYKLNLIKKNIYNKPIVNEQIVNEQIVNKPIVNEPIQNKPIVIEPIVIESILNEPIVNEPILNENEHEHTLNGCPVCDNYINISFSMKQYKNGTTIFTSRNVEKQFKESKITISDIYIQNILTFQYVNLEDIDISYTKLDDFEITIKNNKYKEIKPNKFKINIEIDKKPYTIIGSFMQNYFVYSNV
jgi:hypothetical protein